MFAVAEARGTLDTLNLDGSIAQENVEAGLSISFKQWPVQASEFTEFSAFLLSRFPSLLFFARVFVEATVGHIPSSTFLSYVPANVGVLH